MGALGDKVEQTVQTNGYQDPLEEQFDKELSWTAYFTATGDNDTVHISSNDWTQRISVLPVGAILEIAEAIRFQRSLN
jgi:hypothetical protein